MENEIKKQRGGARKGAGRKSIDEKPRTKTINFRVSDEDYVKLKNVDKLTERFLEWVRSL